MEVLNFTTSGSGASLKYTTEFTAEDAVHIHFERYESAPITIYQKGADDANWGLKEAMGRGNAPLIFDENFASDYYPIMWKIVTTSAVINSVIER